MLSKNTMAALIGIVLILSVVGFYSVSQALEPVLESNPSGHGEVRLNVVEPDNSHISGAVVQLNVIEKRGVSDG